MTDPCVIQAVEDASKLVLRALHLRVLQGVRYSPTLRRRRQQVCIAGGLPLQLVSFRGSHHKSPLGPGVYPRNDEASAARHPSGVVGREGDGLVNVLHHLGRICCVHGLRPSLKPALSNALMCCDCTSCTNLARFLDPAARLCFGGNLVEGVHAS